MPDEQGRRIRDKLKLKLCDIVARKGTAKESDKIAKATGGRVSHVGLVTEVDQNTGKVTIIHSYPHEEGESAIQEITAEEFFGKKQHVPGTEEVRVLIDSECCTEVIMWAKRLLGDRTIAFDSRFDPYNKDLSCAEFIAHVFEKGGHKLMDESEYCKLNWFYRLIAWLVDLNISPVFITPQQIIDSKKLLTPEGRGEKKKC